MADPICQKIIVNMNTNMSIGRINAQAAHSSIMAVLNEGYWDENENLIIPCANNPAMKSWLKGQFTKVVLKGWSNEQLLELEGKAKSAGIPCGLMNEDGFNTALAIGPGYTEEINTIVGKLNLL